MHDFVVGWRSHVMAICGNGKFIMGGDVGWTDKRRMSGNGGLGENIRSVEVLQSIYDMMCFEGKKT